MDKEVLEFLKKMDEKIDENFNNMNKDIKKLEKKVNALFEYTAEFREEVNVKLSELKDVKEVTKENCYDINLLKRKVENANLPNA
ncbi:hypothetical protein [Clostridium baratii]|uniref:Uncharacterized protein n=1 Tax=Clostridium baratii TaxID=1561 RepID=A0A174VHG1_9CLOT|nr:hypothetical protein [Clostridium baratii]CUQ30499.1 Uncharacterised protein [Clostridium baratii]